MNKVIDALVDWFYGELIPYDDARRKYWLKQARKISRFVRGYNKLHFRKDLTSAQRVLLDYSLRNSAALINDSLIGVQSLDTEEIKQLVDFYRESYTSLSRLTRPLVVAQ